MTSEMIERVARALCWKNGMDPDLTLGGDGENFLWHEYVESARAAIEAMGFPSHGMIIAGQGVALNGQKITAGDAALIYSTMINAATHP